MENLFSKSVKIPLAERLRADSLCDVVGQEHLLGKDGVIIKQIEAGNISSMILWGPPGCGKTTIAKLIAKYVDAEFVEISAVFSGISDLKAVFNNAFKLKNIGRKTILFVDEIHRFNKSQQDSFLPVVESGTIILVGATTENPSFELNSALLSRCQVLSFKKLEEKDLMQLFENALKLLNRKLFLTDDAKKYLVSIADGDGRRFLNIIELLFDTTKDNEISLETIKNLVSTFYTNYDKSGDIHYNLISALHKSLRGSDVNAALYWCARMMLGGENPKYILRRLIRFAMEDVGVADINALMVAINGEEAYNRLGSPEGDIALAYVIIYLATTIKSNKVEDAFNKVMDIAKYYGSLPPPMHIINPANSFMKDQGFGNGYIYDPDTKYSFSGQNYWPEKMEAQEFYIPTDRGYEKEISKRMEFWKKLKEEYKIHK